MSRDPATLLDILEAARAALRFVEGLTKDRFFQSDLHQSAVLRQLEILGEATKRLSAEFRASHPGIPWKEMAGLRDILIHAYDAVDLEEVWKAIVKDLPAVVAAVEPLVPPPKAAGTA